MMSLMGTLTMAAIWVMCLLHIQASSWVGFTRRDREALMHFKSFSVLCVVQFAFNVAIACFPENSISGKNPMRFLIQPLTEASTLQDVAWQARASEHLFHMLVPGGLFFGYVMWPLQGFVWPFVSALGSLRCWHRRSWASPLTAREAEQALEPLGISLGHDYMGNVVQPVCCSLLLFFASGVAWQIFLCLGGWSLFMIVFMRYCHLRACRKCFFTTNRLDTEALFGWGATVSMVFAASAYWASRLRAWPMHVVPLAWLLGITIWGFLLAVVVRPLSLPKQEGHACNRPNYDQVRAKRFYDWHNCNPIKVLVSHCCENEEPICPFHVGKEYLQTNGPDWVSRRKAVESTKNLATREVGGTNTAGWFSSFGMPEVETVIQGSLNVFHQLLRHVAVLGGGRGAGGARREQRTATRVREAAREMPSEPME